MTMIHFRYSIKILLLIIVFCIKLNIKIVLAENLNILAIVDNQVITNFDLEKFQLLICEIEKTHVKNYQDCNSQFFQYFAMMNMMSYYAKKSYLEKINAKKYIEKNNLDLFVKDFYDKNSKNIKKVNQEILKDYLETEYLWNAIIGSAIDKNSISDEEIFLKMKEFNFKNKDEALNAILLDKINEKSEETMNMIKKFYFIEMR